jgi:hypothetical protein
MVAKSCSKDHALKGCVHKKPDTDSARHCIAVVELVVKNGNVIFDDPKFADEINAPIFGRVCQALGSIPLRRNPTARDTRI